jgi:hypothetical protein
VTESTRVERYKYIFEVQEFLLSKNMLSYKGESMIAVNDIEKKIVIFTYTTNL